MKISEFDYILPYRGMQWLIIWQLCW